MDNVLYADVLFFIDFSMDVVAVWLAGIFMHVKTSAKRVSAAAFIGALISVVLTVISPNRVIVLLAGILTAFIMCKISFRVNLKGMLKHTCALWLTGLLLGGVMSHLTGGSFNHHVSTRVTHADDRGITLLPIAILLCAVLVFAASKISLKKTVTVKIALLGTVVTVSGLVDSGNLLRDPLSGYPVIMITKKQASRLLDSTDIESMIRGNTEVIDPNLRPRFRSVFAKGVTGETMIICFRPDEVHIGSKPCRAIIGITDSDKYIDGIECIVPSSLI